MPIDQSKNFGRGLTGVNEGFTCLVGMGSANCVICYGGNRTISDTTLQFLGCCCFDAFCIAPEWLYKAGSNFGTTRATLPNFSILVDVPWRYIETKPSAKASVTNALIKEIDIYIDIRGRSWDVLVELGLWVSSYS